MGKDGGNITSVPCQPLSKCECPPPNGCSQAVQHRSPTTRTEDARCRKRARGRMHGPWIMDHGSWIMDHGWIMDGSWIMDHGSWIMEGSLPNGVAVSPGHITEDRKETGVPTQHGSGINTSSPGPTQACSIVEMAFTAPDVMLTFAWVMSA